MKFSLLLILFSLFTLPAFSQQLAFQGDGNQSPTVYPNPAVDFIGINHAEGVQEIHLYNLVGKRLKVFSVIEGRMYFIGDLPKGLYLVQFFNAENEVIVTKRLNKQ